MEGQLSEPRDGGFTLVEVMVVVLIISVLIAIAIPTFVGARARAQNVEAQSRLDTAIKAAEVYFSSEQTFAGLANSNGWGVLRNHGATALRAIEPAITFTAGAIGSIDSELVDGNIQGTNSGAARGDGQLLALWTPSQTGIWYCAVVAKQESFRWSGPYPAGIHKGQDPVRNRVDSPADCLRRSKTTDW